MYKCYKDTIVAGKESFPLPWIIGENLFYILMWVLMGYLLWPLWTPFGIPLLTILWAVLVVVIQVLLKNHNCGGCYYYDKKCHLGWGKISSAFFTQDRGSQKVGMRLTLFYIITPLVVFIASLLFAIIKDPGWLYWCALVLFVFLNVASFPLRKKGCRMCAMRECCAGSAAKSKRNLR
jgi:hypothetical protein